MKKASRYSHFHSLDCPAPKSRKGHALLFRAFPILMAIIFGTVFPLPCQTIYHWTDLDGITHFSDHPPPDEATLIKKFKEEKDRKAPRSPKSEKEQAPPELGRFTVTYVYDGDSFEARGHNLTIQVRLVGIDAPETGKKGHWGQPFSRRAKNFLDRAIGNRIVLLKGYGSDSYNRQLAEVFADDSNIGLELVESGLAETYSGVLPEGFNAAAYKQAEIRAKKAGLGIWSLGDSYESPFRYRKRNR